MFEIERERSKRVASATFRLSEGVYLALQKEAEKQDTSLNTLVNQVLDAHVNDRVFLQRLDYLRVNKLTFRRILEGTTDQSLIESGAASGTETIRTITLGRSGTVNLDNIVDTIYRLAEFSGFARYSEMHSDGKRVIVLAHDYGPKWSTFIGSFAAAAFKLVSREPKITVGERSVVIEV
jgi:hypothetical protein